MSSDTKHAPPPVKKRPAEVAFSGSIPPETTEKGTEEEGSLKKRYKKEHPKAPKPKVKELWKKIRAATEPEVRESLKAEIPKSKPKSRAQTSLTGLARLNTKNKRKHKIHQQVDEAYEMTAMNYVSKASAARRDVNALKHNWAHAKYIPSRFPAASLTVREPRSVASIYDSGEIGLAGNKSGNDALIAATLVDYHYAIREGREITLANFQPVNITTSCNTGVPIDLERFYTQHEKMTELNVTYEPTLIQAIQLRIQAPSDDSAAADKKDKKRPSMVFNIFATGRFCSVGHKSDAEVKEAKEQLGSYIEKWAVNDYEKVKELEAAKKRAAAPVVVAVAGAL